MYYLDQLEKAILYIEENLREDIKVEDVSSFSGYSYYHFHRVFEAVLGETAGNYIRNRRMTCAAHDLIYSGRRITDIAVDYQFESLEAFCRAFKKVYKVTPGTFRKNRIDVIIGNKRELSRSSMKHLESSLSIVPDIRYIDDVKLIGIRGKNSLSDNKLKELWARFSLIYEHIPNKLNEIRNFGICEVNPEFDLTKFDENTESSYFIGTEVSSVKSIPNGMEPKVLKGGKYAVFTHKGGLSTIGMTYDYIWGTWILCSGQEIDYRDDFELYDYRFIGKSNSGEMDIYIPVR